MIDVSMVHRKHRRVSMGTLSDLEARARPRRVLEAFMTAPLIARLAQLFDASEHGTGSPRRAPDRDRLRPPWLRAGVGAGSGAAA